MAEVSLETVTPALFFGAVFDLILFGILTAQVYIYYISFPKDRVILKISVVWVYLAGVAQTALTLLDLRGPSAMSFHALDLGTPGSRLLPDHLSLSITASTGAVAIFIQSLYAHRIYLISKKRWLAIMIICMSLCQFASSIFGAVCYRQEQAVSSGGLALPQGANSLARTVGFTLLWGPINIICDLTITVCMVTFLLRHRKKTMRHQTRSHITKVVHIVIETGMATTVLMIIYAVLFSLWDLSSTSDFHVKTNPLFPGPGLMMSKIYSNSMLVLLNNRAIISNGRNAVESFEFVEVSARGLEGDIESRNRGGNSTASIQVH